MGCIWSSSEADVCRHCSRRAVNNLIIINHECEVCITNATRCTTVKTRPYFGEYLCVCGNQWTSRLSWAYRYQKCQRCRSQVYPIRQRPLRPSDMGKDKERKDHRRDLCQMCQEIGSYCGGVRK